MEISMNCALEPRNLLKTKEYTRIPGPRKPGKSAKTTHETPKITRQSPKEPEPQPVRPPRMGILPTHAITAISTPRPASATLLESSEVNYR